MTPARRQPILLALCVAALVLLASPPGRQLLEARLATHMLVQMPCLVLIGIGFGRLWAGALDRHVAPWNRGGVTGLLLALAISMVWMLPRVMDAALVDLRFEAGKFVSLPVAGLALAWSYPRASTIVKGVLNAHVISVLGVMGWAYLAAPARLCNAYLVSDQEAAGAGLLGSAAALSAYFAMLILFGPIRPRAAIPPHRPTRASIAAQ